MKSTLKYLLPSLLVVMYLTASVGIGVHKCDKDGTSTVVFLFEDASSESVHQNNHYHNGADKCGVTCSQEHHDHNCCHTELHNLEKGYDLSHSVLLSQILASSLTIDFADCINVSFSEKAELNSSEILYGSPPIILQRNPHSYFAQWRL